MAGSKLQALCLLLVTLLFAAAPAAAQSVSATIVGRVVESTGKPVDAATVQAAFDAVQDFALAERDAQPIEFDNRCHGFPESFPTKRHEVSRKKSLCFFV
jgi:hypothetical protein